MPATVAVNWPVAPRLIDRAVGLTATDVTATGVVMVTWAEAESEGVSALAAVTRSGPAVAGAVYTPALVIVPRWADQVTAEL